MKIVFSSSRKVQQFATIFANLKSFTDNVCLYFRPTGVYIQCIDDSHCCLFECELCEDWFESYDYHEETDQSCIGLNIAMLNKVMAAWHDSQTFSVELANGSDKIALNFVKDDDENAPDNGQFDKFFELPLIILESELMNVQLIETLVDLTVASTLFCSLIKQLMIFNDVLTLTFNEETIECVSSGSDGSMKAIITADEVKEYAIPESTAFTQSYSLRYVQTMCNFNKLDTEMKMGFGNNMPMMMTYSLSDEEDEHQSFARLHLAPKLEDEDSS